MQTTKPIKEIDLVEIRNYLPRVSDAKSISNYFNIFSDTTRVLIIAALSVSELCVNELSELLTVNQTTISHQLKLLRDLKIVDNRREGSLIIYRIINPYVNEVMNIAVNQVKFQYRL